MGTVSALSRTSSGASSASASDNVRHDDSRLSNVEHTTNKGATNGYAPLVSGIVPHDYYQYATTTTDGSIILTGDLGGLATSPTVPGLANKANLNAPTFTGTTNFWGPLITTPDALTDAATIATDASLGNHFRCTVAASRTLGVPTNPTDGQRAIWELTASGGPWTVTPTTGSSGAFAFGSDIAALSAIASGKTDYIGAVYNSTAARWRIIAYVKGY